MPDLNQLRERHESLKLEAETHLLEAQIREIEQANRIVMQEGFGDLVNPREYLYDSPNTTWGLWGDTRITRPEDRQHGDNFPFWQTEQELSIIRGIGRHIADTDEVAISAINNLANYVLGRDGFAYTAEAKEGVETDTGLLRAVQAAIDDYIEDNEWEGDLEREAFTRAHRFGEVFLPIEDAGGGHARTETIECDDVTEPDSPRLLEDWLGVGQLDWKYGIAKEPNRPQRVHGYFVERFGDASDWEFYRPDQLTHIKHNVDRVVARGMSDFYAVYIDLERASKLLGNTLQGSAIQAAIAYIKESAPGVRAKSIESSKGGLLDWTGKAATGSGQTKEVTNRRFLPGTILSVPQGTKYHSAPLGTPNGPAYIDIVQAGLRYVGMRWTMPEYMISGDASNGNFASTLVAESPFTKSTEAKQSFWRRKYTSHFWRVLGIAARAGRFSRWGVTDLRDLKQLVQLAVTVPDVAVRDEVAQHQIRKEEHESGLLSLETWAEETGRDLQVEQDRGAAPKPSFPAPSMQESLDPLREAASIWRDYP